MSRELLKHHQKCQDQSCEVCTPVKNYVARQRAAQDNALREQADSAQRAQQAQQVRCLLK